jgi:Matrixin
MRKSSTAITAAALAAIFTTFASAPSAFAFCQTSSCPQGSIPMTGSRCMPPQAVDCGITLFWPSACVGYSIQQDASKRTSFATVQATVQQAFATWMAAECTGGGSPHILIQELEPVACHEHEYNQGAANANAIMFRDDSWPYTGADNTLALTTVTYNLDNGEIYDADMELNSASIAFTTGDARVQFDLLSVLTHETGHFLGLSHSAAQDATMFPSYRPGDTALRSLGNDDIAGICTIYPPGKAIDATCDATPRHGFSTLCKDQQSPTPHTPSAGCCAVAPGAAPRDGSAAGLAALAAALFAARRRARAGR